MDSQPQQAEVEAVYNSVRTSLATKDFDAFTALIEPAKEGPALAKDDWLEATDFLLDAYPDLANTRFQRIRSSGDWAGYYTLTDLDDTNFINITMFKFHRVGGRWKLSGGNFGLSMPSLKDDADVNVQ